MPNRVAPSAEDTSESAHGDPLTGIAISIPIGLALWALVLGAIHLALS